jgi:opacity protein-like surface antigen
MKSANGTAPNIGAMIGYKFSPDFSFGVRVDYDSRFASNTGRVAGTCTDYDPETGFPVDEHDIVFVDKYETKVNYLAISAIPSIHFDGFLLYGGASFATPLSKSVQQSVSIEDSGSCQFFFATDDSTKVIAGRSTGSDNLKERISLKFGAGYIYELNSRLGITLLAGYDLSLNDIFEKDETLVLQNERTRGEESQIPMTVNRKLRFNSLQGSIGLRINL